MFSLEIDVGTIFIVARRFRERIAAFADSAEGRFLDVPLLSTGVVFSMENFDNGRERDCS